RSHQRPRGIGLAVEGDLTAEPEAVEQPGADLAPAGVMPDEVGVTVAVEVGDGGDAPAGVGLRGQLLLRDPRHTVHDPDAVAAEGRVAPDEVGIAVAIEVAGAHDLPAGIRLGRD